MFRNVAALEGFARDWEIQGHEHAAHMLQACGLGSSHCLPGQASRGRAPVKGDSLV